MAKIATQNQDKSHLIDTSTTLPQKIGGKTVYRRQFTKRDGRDIFFYGYQPHNLTNLKQMGGEVAKGGELRWHKPDI